jgi:hypothetical protein
MPYPPMPPSPFPPYHRWYTDVEPAYEKPAECECHFPPMPDNCICVTEEDANNWNGAYNTISAVSAGLDIQAIASAAQLLTSADFWNQTYTEVSSNSALWNKLPEVSGKLAETAQSALWIASTLSANGVKHDDTLSGDGVHVPLSVAYSERFEQLYDQFLMLTANYDAEALFNAMKQCKEDLTRQIKELSGGHVQNFELILHLMGVVPISGKYPELPLNWTNDQSMHSDDESSYQDNNTLNWIYYSTY